MKKQLNVKLDPQTHQSLKEFALNKKISMSELIRKEISRLLGEKT